MNNSSYLLGAGACLVVLVIVAVTSIAAVPPLHWGIRYNQFNKAADVSHTYAPGRYVIGPMNQFFLFPSNIQTIEFVSLPALTMEGTRYGPLISRTQEGLGLTIQLSLQYRLSKDQLGQLASKYKDTYAQVFATNIRTSLISGLSFFKAEQLWSERVEIQKRMQEMVNDTLSSTFAECWDLQLLVIDLPDKNEQAIVSTQVQKQSAQLRQAEQEASLVRAQTEVIRSEYGRQIKVIRAQGEANYTVLTMEAQARAQKNTINTESAVLGSLMNDLELDGAGLVTYQQYSFLDDMPESSIWFGFGASSPSGD